MEHARLAGRGAVATGPRAAAGRLLLHPAAKPLLWLLCLLPLVWLVAGAALDRLGANPAEALIRSTGDWTLRMLCLTLAITPLRLTLALPALARFRRMLGLWTFAYAALHLLCYAWFDMGLDAGEIARDVAKRPFILVGMGGFALLLVLAATSFNRAIRWLGARRWQRLHRSVYLIAGLAVLHFFWMRAGKNDFAEVAVYAGVLVTLLLSRLWLRRGRGATA
ncbi:sulfite oxidase heme-binding subunit YedZ [Diaphorobacter sp.]|uniref:sulfite oxidase heme-binding subunit YedZ n=1 Tax=Diaphorobacter sp. TaxID=1934310 RepID=UPI003D112F4F